MRSLALFFGIAFLTGFGSLWGLDPQAVLLETVLGRTEADHRLDAAIVRERVPLLGKTLSDIHPRLLLKKNELVDFRTFVRSADFASRHPDLVSNLVLEIDERNLPSEPERLPGGARDANWNKVWSARVNAAHNTAARAEHFAFSYLVTGEVKYAREASRWLLHLAGWDYDNNITLAYSLNAFNSWEGYTVAFNGTKGRLEHTAVEQVYVNGTNTVQGAIKEKGITTTVIPIRGPARAIEPWTGEGGHGGGDKVLLDDLFLPEPPKDKYLRAADERAGAASILIGVAANKCFKTKQPVVIGELVKGLKQPDYAPMPSRTGPLPMPGKSA